MKKIAFAALAVFFAGVCAFSETHVYDKLEGYRAEWTLDEDQEIELKELEDGQLHADGIYVERPVSDPRYSFVFSVETDFGKNALEKKVVSKYDVTISYNILSKSGVIQIKTDLKNHKTLDLQLSKILTELWRPLCFEALDRSCIKPIKDRVKTRNGISTLEFHYHPNGETF